MAAPTVSQWYRLTNAYTGPNLSLDVVNDNGTSSTGLLQMSPSGNFSGQYWQLTPFQTASSLSSTYALYTLFLGASKRLDVYGNDAKSPHLADGGDHSGQVWTIFPWGDGTWQLWNQFSGSALHLDIYSDTHQPFMDTGDSTGQHWTFTLINGTPSSSLPPSPPSSIPPNPRSSIPVTSSSSLTTT